MRQHPSSALLPFLLLVLGLAACGTTGATPASPGAVGSDPGTPIETITPPPVQPTPGGAGPGTGEHPGAAGAFTIPSPGQLDVHPVPADLLEAAIDGRRVTVRIAWTSGVEPCYVLDSILVDRDTMTFAVTIREGHAPGDNICIEIAKAKFTLVDLGELAPGTYTISDAMGGAAPIEVVVS